MKLRCAVFVWLALASALTAQTDFAPRDIAGSQTLRLMGGVGVEYLMQTVIGSNSKEVEH